MAYTVPIAYGLLAVLNFLQDIEVILNVLQGSALGKFFYHLCNVIFYGIHVLKIRDQRPLGNSLPDPDQGLQSAGLPRSRSALLTTRYRLLLINPRQMRRNRGENLVRDRPRPTTQVRRPD